MVEPDFPHYSDLDKPVTHYCWICDTEEECKEDRCDFRDQFRVHGYCMVKVKKLIYQSMKPPLISDMDAQQDQDIMGEPNE